MNTQRIWDNQTAGSRPIRKQWLAQATTSALLDLLELGAVIRNDRQMEGSALTDPPRYIRESIIRIREEIFDRAGKRL